MNKFLLYLSLLGSLSFFSFSQDIELANMTPEQGFKIYGAVTGGFFGIAVKSVGDINGDEKPDILIGAPAWGSGRGIIIYGQSSYPDIIDMASPPAGYGFQIESQAEDRDLGYFVDNSGDINGDGIADIVLGASSSDLPGRPHAGAAYVLFGTSSGFPDIISTSSIGDGNGFRIIGAGAQNFLGGSVSNGGDINNDGFDDLVIGATGATPNDLSIAGTAYVIYGRSTGFPDLIDTSNFDNSLGFRILGSNQDDHLGQYVTIGGDVNGDQIDDLLVSSTFYHSNGLEDNGAVFVIFGNPAGHSDIEIANLQSDQGFKIVGNQNQGYLGISISSAGDINGDGINDIIIGEIPSDPDATNPDIGTYYIIYGSATGFPDTVDVGSLTPPQGFKIITSDPNAGFFGAGVNLDGDVNGDGIDDIIVSAATGGIVYVLFGSTNGFPAVVDVNLMTTQQGYKIIGVSEGDGTGFSMSSLDINEDGADDIVIGASLGNYLDRENVGAVYVVYGKGFCTEGYINWDDTCVEECNPPYIPTTEGNVNYCNYPCRLAQYLTWKGKCSCYCRGGVEEIVNEYKFCREGSSLGDL